MRSITVTMNISLDGVVQGPGRPNEDTRGGFTHGGWGERYNDEVMGREMAKGMSGQGDMLFSPVGASKLQRIQGAYVDEDQIAELTDGWRRQGEPEFQEELLEEVESESSASEEEDSLSANEDPQSRDTVTARHHDKPLYILSGAQHPRFGEILSSLITAEQGERVGLALAPLMG